MHRQGCVSKATCALDATTTLSWRVFSLTHDQVTDHLDVAYCAAGGFSLMAVTNKLKKLVKKAEEQATMVVDHFGMESCVLGFNPTTDSPNPSCAPLRKDVATLADILLGHSNVFTALRGIATADFHSLMKTYIGQLGSGLGMTASSSKAIITLGRGPPAGSPTAGHPPPLCVSRILGVPPCVTECSTCEEFGCSNCLDCCMDCYGETSGVTCLTIVQKRATASKRSYLVVGDVCYPATEGIVAVFDGSTVPYGVWSPVGSPVVHCLTLILPKAMQKCMIDMSSHDIRIARKRHVDAQPSSGQDADVADSESSFSASPASRCS